MAQLYDNKAFDDIQGEQRYQGYSNTTSSYPGLHLYRYPYSHQSPTAVDDRNETKRFGANCSSIIAVVAVGVIAVIVVAVCIAVFIPGRGEEIKVIVSTTSTQISEIIFICTFTVVSLDGTEVTFIPAYTNTSTVEYLTLVTAIENEIDSIFLNSALSDRYLKSVVTQLRGGSIRVDFELYFRDAENSNSITKDTSEGDKTTELRNSVRDILHDAISTSQHNNGVAVLSGVVPNSVEVHVKEKDDGITTKSRFSVSPSHTLPPIMTSSYSSATDSPSGSNTVSSSLTSPNTQQQHSTSRGLPRGCGIRPKSDPQPAPRIVGGSTAWEGDWPWLVSLQNDDDGHFCGATLIEPQLVLTAAHCLKDEVIEELFVVFGTSNISSSASLSSIRVKTAVQHPMYVGNDHDYDLAVLKLQESVVYDDYVYPICLPPSDLTVAEDTVCTIVGWGKTTETGDYTSTVIEASVPIVSWEDCREYISEWTSSDPLTSRMFCAGQELGGVDACEGDSGGPLMCQLDDNRWHLYGIISWGYGCARPRLPGIYSKVNEFYGFINQFTDGSL
ncbi:uncharacterized protein LOC144444334 [Glandiceps talaboti]